MGKTSAERQAAYVARLKAAGGVLGGLEARVGELEGVVAGLVVRVGHLAAVEERMERAEASAVERARMVPRLAALGSVGRTHLGVSAGSSEDDPGDAA